MKRRAVSHFYATHEAAVLTLSCVAVLIAAVWLQSLLPPRPGARVITTPTDDYNRFYEVWYSPLHFPALQTLQRQQGTCVCVDTERIFTWVNDHFLDFALLWGGVALLSGGLVIVGYLFERRKGSAK